jgi:uncharacterized RDD family membrane protein YckC/type II secretory pathway pseudopilin PulG
MSQDQMNKNENYRVVFLGVTNGSDENVQAFSEKLSKQFRIPVEKALRITKTAPVVVRKNLSRVKAEQYQEAFVRIGGQARIEQTDAGTGDHPAQASPARVEGFETSAVETPIPIGKSSDIAKAYDDDVAGAYEEGFTPPTGGSRKASDVTTFQCPQCGQEQDKGIECIKCGIIFEKYDRMVEATAKTKAEIDQDPAEAESFPEDMEIKIEHAGFWLRLGAYIVDEVIVGLIMVAVALGLAILLGVGRDPRAIASLGPVVNVIFLFMPFAYSIYFLGKRGYTPGKGFLRLQVIRQDGTGISYGDAAIRTFSYILSSIPLLLGFFWIGFDRNKQGWHDKIAKTQVIKAEEIPTWRKVVVFVPVILVPLIGILAAIGIPLYVKYNSRADVVRVVSDLETVKSHLEEHYYRHDSYPLTGEFRPFLKGSLGQIPSDPFNNGRPYRYESDGSRFTLWSVGPDREDNSAMIPYDPFLSRGFQKSGDIIFRSDEEIDEDSELFEITSEGTEQSGESLGMAPSPL